MFPLPPASCMVKRLIFLVVAHSVPGPSQVVCHPLPFSFTPPFSVTYTIMPPRLQPPHITHSHLLGGDPASPVSLSLPSRRPALILVARFTEDAVRLMMLD